MSGVVGGGGDVAAVTGPVGVMGRGAGRVVNALIGVSAEIVALGLEQVGREAFAAEGVVEVERGGKGGRGNAFPGGGGDDVAPGTLGVLDGFLEKLVEEQIGEFG